MVRIKFKWKFAFFFHLILLNVFTKSKPIGTNLNSFASSDTLFSELVIPSVSVVNEEETVPSPNVTSSANILLENVTHNTLLRNAIRPGQTVNQYEVDITIHPGGNFDGHLLIAVQLTIPTREEPIVLHVEDLNIERVYGGQFNIDSGMEFSYFVDEGRLEIEPAIESSTYTIGIEYTGSIRNGGSGLFRGEYKDINYLAMNLHPTNARRVFPCMDEPDIETTVRFNFHDIDYNNIFMNSASEDDSQSNFVGLSGPPHRWGMVAHNFNAMLSPVVNVFLYGRPGLSGQESQASVFMNFYYTALNEWTEKPYLEIIVGQDGRLHVIALPDTSRDWYALSTVCIWEPYVFMESIHSAKQRKLSFVKIAEAMARQWFGYVIYPENWRYQWVITGLGKYAAYEAIRSFQENSIGTELLIDANTVFVTDVIQESLLQDSYLDVLPLELDEDLLEEEPIRDYVNGLLNYKAPALMWLIRLVMGGQEDDVIQRAARNLLHSNSIAAVNAPHFHDALGDALQNTELVDDVGEFLESWLQNSGYPLLHVGLRPGGVLVMQERFGFSTKPQVGYSIPITYTTSTNMDFDNIYPTMMMDGTTTLDMALGEEDFVLFNLQGQGYYRVNYDTDLWERIIEALNDPDRRAEIHPLNRATLVDDALNCARAGKLDYDIAFQVVLSMEHETEYAVWKAFVRNMNFLRKRLVAYVDDDEDLDPDIYLRMVRRTVGLVENEIGFYPDPMINEPAMASLTRGLVMDHACRANYQPCIAAAVDWFYDPNNAESVVNPNIPHDIRPAVYCTMVREGDDQVIAALYARLEIEPTLYERVVILESLACSEDEGFIRILLEETIAANSPYTVEERSRIFAAIAESSYQNARIAANFIAMRTIEVRNSYGGPEKLEELLFVLADNMADGDLSGDFTIWVNNINSNLDDSLEIAKRAASQVTENLQWDANHMEYVYEWIDENDAHTLLVSLVLVAMPFMIVLFNY